VGKAIPNLWKIKAALKLIELIVKGIESGFQTIGAAALAALLEAIFGLAEIANWIGGRIQDLLALMQMLSDAACEILWGGMVIGGFHPCANVPRKH